jgi:hypothetical protein
MYAEMQRGITKRLPDNKNLDAHNEDYTTEKTFIIISKYFKTYML